jgi:hypothetical protein
MSSSGSTSTLRQRVAHEIREYLINFVYLALFFSAIVFYRRALLAEDGIVVHDYFLGVIKALVIGKIIMLGALLRFSRSFEDRPLIVPTLFKTMLFTLLVVVCDGIEFWVRSWISSGGPMTAFGEFKHHMTMSWLGSIIVVAVCFLPFFAMKEVSRVLGGGMIRRMFFIGSTAK